MTHTKLKERQESCLHFAHFIRKVTQRAWHNYKYIYNDVMYKWQKNVHHKNLILENIFFKCFERPESNLCAASHLKCRSTMCALNSGFTTPVAWHQNSTGLIIPIAFHFIGTEIIQRFRDILNLYHSWLGSRCQDFRTGVIRSDLYSGEARQKKNLAPDQAALSGPDSLRFHHEWCRFSGTWEYCWCFGRAPDFQRFVCPK